MTIRHRIARTLDRPGGRRLLRFLATRLARLTMGGDVRFLYDEGWIQAVDGHYIVASQRFAWDNRLTTAYTRLFDTCRDYWFHVYQPVVGDTIIDVGAGNGADVIVFSKLVGSAGKVLAIEAHPDTYRLLQKQCEWNCLENVDPLHHAVMDQSGVVYIDDNADDVFNSVTVERGPRKTHAVQGDSLDEICRAAGIDHVDFLKMNIEGAERFAIKGMETTLSRTRNVCIACHDFLADRGASESMRTKQIVVEFLHAAGFETVSRDDDPRDYVRGHVHGWRRGHFEQLQKEQI